jgi:hypothetical protein
MNERIRELAEQAGYSWHNQFSGPILSPNAIEKFAELIVKECLKKIEEEYKPVMEDKEMMKDTHWDGYVQCGVDSYVSVREHFFGVEE